MPHLLSEGTSVDGPRGSFTEYVEWLLVLNDSPFTVCPVDADITNPTSDPESSQLSAMPSVELLEPTINTKVERSPEVGFIPEPESNAVC